MKRLIITICLIAIHLSAFAEIESGAYIIGSLGYGYVSNGTGYNVTNNTSYSLGLSSGYAFNKYFALDGGLTFMPNSYHNQTTNYYLTDIAVRGSVPLSSFFSGYIHLGPGLLLSDSSSNNAQVGFFAGLGGLFQVSQHIGINIEDYGIFIPGNTNSNINILAVGFAYEF